MSESGKNPDDMDPQGTSRTYQMTKGNLPVQDEEGLSSGIKLSAQPSLKERAEYEPNREDQHGDSKTHSLPQEASGTNVPSNQYLVGDEEMQKGSQDAHARRNNEVQPETNNTTSEARHTGSSTNQAKQDEEIPGEGDKPASDQSDQKTRQQFEGQGENVDTQSSPQEAATQKSSKNQEVDLEKGVKEHNIIQALQENDDVGSEDMNLVKTASQKRCPKQNSTEPEDENKEGETEEVKRTTLESKNSTEPEYTDTASEIQEPPVQKAKELPVQGNASSASKTTDIRAEEKEGRDSGVHRIAEQRESEEKIHPLTLINQIQEEKYQEVQESLKEWNTQKSSMTQELNIEEEDVHPRIERAAVPEEARLIEKRKAEILMSDEVIFATAGNPELRDQKQELVQPENKSGRENKRVDHTSDKFIKEDDDYQGQYHEATISQSYERSSKTYNSSIPNNPESGPEASDQSGQRESHRQAEPFTEYVQESQHGNPSTQKQVTLGEENITQEIVLQSNRKDESLTEKHGLPLEVKHQNNHSSVTKGPEPALEPSGHPEESIEGAENTKSSLEKEVPGALKEDLKNQVSITQCPAKEDGRKGLPVLIVSIKKEDETLEAQKILVKNKSENNLDLETQEPATWKKEKESLQESARKEDIQQELVQKRHSYSVSQSDLNEKTERNQQYFSAETGTLSSNPSCMYPQENILQQTGITQDPAQPIKTSSTEPHNDPSEILVSNDSQVSQQCTKELLNEGPAGTKQTASIQALEEKQGLGEKSQYHKEKQETQSNSSLPQEKNF